jgi:hypothetical protein
LTNTTGAPASISVVSGSGQSATVSTSFALPLIALVRDVGNNPVSNVPVTFTAPIGGASGIFSGSNSNVYTGQTDVNGLITTTVFSANSIAGSYTVTATAGSIAIPANFDLTNTPVCKPLIVSVNNDDGSGSSCGTFSYALAHATSGNTISFNLPQSNNVITATGYLPTVPAGITIDAGCTSVSGRGTPGVVLTASGVVSDGLRISSSTIITGMAITGFGGYAIDIQGNNNQITCSWLGTADGLTAAPNGGGFRLGIVGGSSANNNYLGIPGQPQSGNLVSGNNAYGILVNKGTGNQSYYTWIGRQKNGSLGLKNGSGGIKIMVGGQIYLGAGNLIGS